VAVRSIIDVEIDPEGHMKAFASLYEKYQSQLAKAPGMWAAASKEVQAQRQGFEAIAAAILAQNELTARAAKEQKNNRQEIERSAVLWRDISRSTSRVAGNVKDMTLSLLKWASVTGVISGLAGAGGLFGIDRLATGVSSTRRSSMGLGIGYGDLRAFGANFSRLVDPESFLSGVAGAKLDVQQRVGLIGAGLTPQEINAPTGDTATALLRNLFKISDTTNPALYEQVINSRHLGNFVSKFDLERFRETGPDERRAMLARFGEDRQKFDLPRDVQRGWQELTTQMTRAGQGIENTFVRGLAPLTRGLTKLSESVEEKLRSFLGSPLLGKWMKDLDEGLEKFAGYIGTEDFSNKVGDFVNGIGKLASAVVTAVSWISGSDPELRAQRDARSQRVTKLRRERAEGKATIGGQFIDIFRTHDPNTFDNSNTFDRRFGSQHLFSGRPPSETGAFSGDGYSKKWDQFPASENIEDRRSDSVFRKYVGAHVEDIIKQLRHPFTPNNAFDKRFGEWPDAPSKLSRDAGADDIFRLIEAMRGQRVGAYDKYRDTKITVEIIKPAGGDTAVSVNGLKN